MIIKLRETEKNKNLTITTPDNSKNTFFEPIFEAEEEVIVKLIGEERPLGPYGKPINLFNVSNFDLIIGVDNLDNFVVLDIDGDEEVMSQPDPEFPEEATY